MQGWVILPLLLSLGVLCSQGQNGLAELPVPRGLTLQPDLPAQTLSLTWQSDSSLFDIEIFHTELMNVVLNETVAVKADPVTGQHGWTWLSPSPLECTSHSVRIRARNQQAVSQWSTLQTIPGFDIPEKSDSYMYPQDKVVPVGSNMTFCCIVKEKYDFKEIMYRDQKMSATRLSRRTYAITVTNQPASSNTGTNVVCCSPLLTLTGAVVFVGYPPGDGELVCETRDLASAECSWKKGRDTHLKRRITRTKYTLNGRDCLVANEGKTWWCSSKVWEGNWTLVARNPLGTVQLTDSAQLADRVHLLAPENVMVVKVKAWNATLQWSWPVEAYKKLEMVCQLQLIGHELSSTRNYSGTGLSFVMLEGLWPDADYTVTVRCGSKHAFWKWGDESAPYSIHTKMDRPDALDVWLWMDSNNTGRVLWKRLSVTKSHGALVGFEVSQSSAEEDGWTTVYLSPESFSYPIILNSSDITVAVAARNPAGLSQPSTVTIPAYRADSQMSVSELLDTNGPFDLSWQPNANASRGYVVEWVPTGCSGLCPVNWEKVPESDSSFTVKPDSLEEGVRYNVSVYVLSTGTAMLLQRWQGYSQEMIPAQSVGELSANQIGSDVMLSWKATAMEHQRGFIRGYTIYLANAAHLDLVANITDPEVRSYRVKGLPLSSYKFIVKAYNSAGEDTGSTVAIKMEMDTADMLFVGILVPLAAMFCCLILISVCCYKKRDWVKKAFYPEIPGPKVPGDWSSPPGPLDVKPSPHSLVHIVESPEWDFRKKGLVPVPEEEEESENDNIEVDTDSDEPALLRYYNQVVGDGSHSNHVSDSSGSSTASVGSTQTEITYTGIQSPTSSQGVCDGGGGYRPQMQSAADPAEPQDEFEADFQDDGLNIGYKPQCSWQLDSPEAENFSGSLGSPTSVTSSQFLIPESSEEKPQSSSTWFHSFLSGKS